MQYNRVDRLKDGREVVLRSGLYSDGEQVLNVFNTTHAETDFLLTYPDENHFTIEVEADFLQEKLDRENEVEILALVDGQIVGTAGIESMGDRYKTRHRAEFGISILKDYWGLGIGGLLMGACIECARKAGYLQLELNVVAENVNAIALYKKVGFVEYGRNPKGFQSRVKGFQEVVYMRLEL